MEKKPMVNARFLFLCESVLLTGYGEEVTLRAEYSSNSEEQTYSKTTPTADMKFTVTNEELFGFWKPGKKYYFDCHKKPEIVG